MKTCQFTQYSVLYIRIEQISIRRIRAVEWRRLMLKKMHVLRTASLPIDESLQGAATISRSAVRE
jgi:hypothetical protein